jgi:hypothetical protein
VFNNWEERREKTGREKMGRWEERKREERKWEERRKDRCLSGAEGGGLRVKKPNSFNKFKHRRDARPCVSNTIIP